MVRTLVVATATVAILLVCFSIYQYAQIGTSLVAERLKPRLPSPMLRPAAPDSEAFSPKESLTFGQANVGAGRNVRIAIYEPEGTRVRFQIAVRSWTPIEGVPDQYNLDHPEIRFRTTDGNAVRVTAKSGMLEASRKSGTGLQPQRGRLSGDVLLEIDRLTESERAKLPQERRGAPDPSELIQITTDEIVFDLDYAKLTVPGDIHLWGRDVDLRATDLEVRFNEIENRVEYFTVEQGGRIELVDAGQQLGLSSSALSPSANEDLTVVEWLRATIEAQLAAVAKASEMDEAVERETEESSMAAEKSASADATEALPVFKLGDEGVSSSRPPVHYFARFEGDVDVRQLVGEQVESRLTADVLEVLRRFSSADRLRGNADDPKQQAKGQDASDQAGDEPRVDLRQRIVLEWTDRLRVETLAPEDPRLSEGHHSRVVAFGEPAEVFSLEGQASAASITFDPQNSRLHLKGSDRRPAMVQSGTQGALRGSEIFLAREGDALVVNVVGPGSITRKANPLAAATGAPMVGTTAQPVQEAWTVRFVDRLDATGRFVKTTRFGFPGGIIIREQRVLDEAHFLGSVKLEQDDGTLEADELMVRFATQPAWLGAQQSIDRVEATGHVKMGRGQDELVADRVDISMAQDAGEVFPRTAVAHGNVTARQGDRILTAKETLTLDFARVERRVAPPSPLKTFGTAFKTGFDPDAVQRLTALTEHIPLVEKVIALTRIRAVGEVTVTDPVEALDLSAESIDCSVTAGSAISTAVLRGSDARPASVSLTNLSVTGAEVRLNVPDQWAEVPGAGRMTFQSYKDLDGRSLPEPIPIAITWTEWMKYHGRENRSVFSGSVHAASESSTTFDCDRLVVEFEDKPVQVADATSKQPWWIFKDLIERVSGVSKPRAARSLTAGISKQPTHLLATGDVVALTSETDPESGALISRVSIRGPKLSLNLRDGVSKMLIEGAGSLLLEDFRREDEGEQEPDVRHAADGGGLFGADASARPSKTLISWADAMWYDFSIHQTRFEGDIELKHFSGAELARIVQTSSDHAVTSPGRSTFLSSDVLTVDFNDQEGESRRDQRMGRLSAERLQRFQALGHVQLEDSTEGLSLSADRVIYEKPRSLLAVYGAPGRRARIVLQKPGQFPQDLSAERFFYNLNTHSVEIAGGRGRFRQ